MRVQIGEGPDRSRSATTAGRSSVLTRSDELGYARVARIQLGDDTWGRSFDIAYDNVVVTNP